MMIEPMHAGGRRVATSLLMLALALPGCRAEPSAETSPVAPAAAPTPPPVAPIAPAANESPAAEPAFAWPASLRPFGEGYPQAGDPCRRLGETSAVADYLDHTRILIGCPGAAESPQASALVAGRGGRIVGEIDGVALLSLPAQ